MISLLPIGETRKFNFIVSVCLGVLVMVVLYPNHVYPIRKAREDALRTDLYAMRTSIDQYILDKQTEPRSLNDLVSAGYWKEIPLDPMTNSRNTWQLIREDSVNAADQHNPGIIDIRSGSHAKGSDGTTYDTW